MEEKFGSSEGVMFVIESNAGTLFSVENLSIIEKYTELSWDIPHATQVNSLANYQYSYADENTLQVEPLIENAEYLSGAEVSRIKKIA